MTATTNGDPNVKCRLGVLLRPDRLELLVTAPYGNVPPVYRTVPLTPGDGYMSSLEEAVYTTPMLTAAHAATDIVLDTPRALLHPTALDSEAVEARGQRLYPSDNITAVTNPLDRQTSLTTFAHPALARFVARTFDNTPVHHRLDVLARYYGTGRTLGNAGVLMVLCQPSHTTIVARDGAGNILMANTFDTHCPEDAMYYTLAAARMLAFDNDTDRIFVDGDRPLRDALMKLLKTHITYTLPWIHPAAAAFNPALPLELTAARYLSSMQQQ